MSRRILQRAAGIPRALSSVHKGVLTACRPLLLSLHCSPTPLYSSSRAWQSTVCRQSARVSWGASLSVSTSARKGFATEGTQTGNAIDSGDPLVCWRCGITAETPAAKLVCGECDTVQPVPKGAARRSHFEVLHVEQTFGLDLGQLEQEYRTLQKKLHPDKFATLSQQEKEYSAAQSTEVNEAYQVLKQPDLRAAYLLSLHGINIGEGATITDPALLMEVLEVREEIESCQGDTTRLQTLLDSTNQQIKDCVTRLTPLFDQGDLEAAKVIAVELQYHSANKRAILEQL